MVRPFEAIVVCPDVRAAYTFRSYTTLPKTRTDLIIHMSLRLLVEASDHFKLK